MSSRSIGKPVSTMTLVDPRMSVTVAAARCFVGLVHSE
jgi:hypothetical protein